MPKPVLLEPPLDENAYRTTVIDRRGNFTQPDVVKGVPATNLSGKRASPAIRHSFGYEMIVSIQQPLDVLVGSCAAVEAPDSPSASCWR
jgi:hypothetical protein